MSRVKILFLSRLYLPHIGGVETHIQKIVKEFGDSFDVTVVTEQHDSTLPLDEKMGQVRTLRIPLRNQQTSKWQIWWWWLRHMSLLAHADVIHVHDVFFWLLPYKCVFFWKKMYMTFHGYENVKGVSWTQKFWHNVAEVLTEGNMCIGGFHQKWYGVTPTVISFGAVEKGKSKLKEKDVLVLNPKAKLKIVFVGRLEADTGILTYLEVVKILQNSYKVQLDVFGDGPERQLAESVVASYKLPVTFYGFVPTAKIERTQYDVAFVSTYLSILEFFMAGVPVVAQYKGALRRDYLSMTPFREWIQIGQTPAELVTGFERVFSAAAQASVAEAYEWSKQQSWAKLAQSYKDLWQVKT